MLKDYLECGHILHTPQDMIGHYYPEKRRCYKCNSNAPIDFDLKKSEKWDGVPKDRTVEELQSAPVETLSLLEAKSAGRLKEVYDYFRKIKKK